MAQARRVYFSANSGQFRYLGSRFEAAETTFHQICARPDTKISRGAFGGQQFG